MFSGKVRCYNLCCECFQLWTNLRLDSTCCISWTQHVVFRLITLYNLSLSRFCIFTDVELVWFRIRWLILLPSITGISFAFVCLFVSQGGTSVNCYLSLASLIGQYLWPKSNQSNFPRLSFYGVTLLYFMASHVSDLHWELEGTSDQFSSWKSPLFIVATVQNCEFYIFKFPSQLFLRRGLVVCLFKSQVAEIEGKFERNSNFWWLLFWSRQTPLEISRPIFYWNCQQNICDGGIGKVLRSCRNGLQSGAGENRHKKKIKRCSETDYYRGKHHHRAIVGPDIKLDKAPRLAVYWYIRVVRETAMLFTITNHHPSVGLWVFCE